MALRWQRKEVKRESSEAMAQVTGCSAERETSLNTMRYRWALESCALWEFVQKIVKANLFSFNNWRHISPFKKNPTEELDNLDVNITVRLVGWLMMITRLSLIKDIKVKTVTGGNDLICKRKCHELCIALLCHIDLSCITLVIKQHIINSYFLQFSCVYLISLFYGWQLEWLLILTQCHGDLNTFQGFTALAASAECGATLGNHMTHLTPQLFKGETLPGRRSAETENRCVKVVIAS